MGKYYIKDYIAHAGNKRGPKKGSQKPGHKYLFRISTGNGYKYFYTLEEYQNRFKKGLKDLGKKVSDSVKNVSGGGKSKAKTVKDTVAKALESVPKRSGKALRKVNKALKKIGGNPVTKVAEKSKKLVEDLVNKRDAKSSAKKEQYKADKRHGQLQSKSKEAQKIINRHESSQKKHDKPVNNRYAGANGGIKTSANSSTKSQKESSIKEPKDHKYLAKIRMSNGKYRYFYSQSELEGYYKKNPKQRIDGLPLKKESATPEEDSKKINPNYDNAYDCGYSNNCYSCSLAYDMRRRGYDVEAIYDEDGSSISNFSKAYKDTTQEDWDIGLAVEKNRTYNYQVNNADLLEKNMAKKYGKNSRGIMAVGGTSGGGHALVWEIDGNSKLNIYDAQDNTKFDLRSNLPYISSETWGIQTLRTDNREPSDQIKKYITTDQTKTEHMNDPDTNEPFADTHKQHKEILG